jgi:hypothetical protein
MTKGLLDLHNSAHILGMLLIILLNHVEIQCVPFLMYLDFVSPSVKSSHSLGYTNLCCT